MDVKYYVLDGHHRVAALKEQGQKFMDGHIVEYLPGNVDSKILLIQRRIEFKDNADLGGINLLHRGDYDKLILQRRNHQKRMQEKTDGKITLKEAARDWHHSLYKLVTSKIKKLNLKQLFPKTTLGDMYVYLCDQARLRRQKAEDQSCPLPEALEEIGILKKATTIIFSRQRIREKIAGLFHPGVSARK